MEPGMNLEDVLAGAALGYLFTGFQGLATQWFGFRPLDVTSMIVAGCVIIALAAVIKKRRTDQV